MCQAHSAGAVAGAAVRQHPRDYINWGFWAATDKYPPGVMDLRGEDLIQLESVNARAITVDKADASAFWTSLTGSSERVTSTAFDQRVQMVWLDALVESDLDRSVGQIGAPTAWEHGLDGVGVTVAVLDTGVDDQHPDLAGKVIAARDFSGSGSTDDRFGHGTHVAATIAGTGAASDGARAGVAPGADLLAGKVLNDSGFGLISWIIDGMEWAAASGADVVNMSLGGAPSDGADPLSLAVNALTDENGTLFVVSAGNDGRVIDRDDPRYDQARAVFAGGINRFLAVIVRPTNADEVARVVAVARDTGLELAVRSGGHSGAGHSVSEGGIVLDLSQMRAIDIDVEGARCGPRPG